MKRFKNKSALPMLASACPGGHIAICHGLRILSCIWADCLVAHIVWTTTLILTLLPVEKPHDHS